MSGLNVPGGRQKCTCHTETTSRLVCPACCKGGADQIQAVLDDVLGYLDGAVLLCETYGNRWEDEKAELARVRKLRDRVAEVMGPGSASPADKPVE